MWSLTSSLKSELREFRTCRLNNPPPPPPTQWISKPKCSQGFCQLLNGRNDYTNQNTLTSPPSKQAGLIVWLLWCMDCQTGWFVTLVEKNWSIPPLLFIHQNQSSRWSGAEGIYLTQEMLHKDIFHRTHKYLNAEFKVIKPHQYFLPFLSVEPDSAGWAASTVDADALGGLHDWLPKFCLFSLASPSSFSKAAVWHCSTVETNTLQN